MTEPYESWDRLPFTGHLSPDEIGALSDDAYTEALFAGRIPWRWSFWEVLDMLAADDHWLRLHGGERA